jgi:hypothetical protein
MLGRAAGPESGAHGHYRWCVCARRATQGVRPGGVVMPHTARPIHIRHIGVGSTMFTGVAQAGPTPDEATSARIRP